MKLKEKCIYFNPENGSHYLVLSISDMVYGRYGDMKTPNYLDSYMNSGKSGLRFKIDDIIINMEYYRNYTIDDKYDIEKLEKFEFVRELTDEEFYPMKLLIDSNFKYPSVTIDIHEHMNDVTELVERLKSKKSELEELLKEKCMLEKLLFYSMS